MSHLTRNPVSTTSSKLDSVSPLNHCKWGVVGDWSNTAVSRVGQGGRGSRLFQLATRFAYREPACNLN